jgi:6-pyruvoyltetrahydropterin/6-carboxytetrahydropterin synthase
VEIYKDITFEAAHLLPNLPEGHKCRRLHGHSYTVRVFAEGPVDPDTGWVVDFGDIQEAFRPIRDQLDHCYLNDIPGLENPTSESLAQWIWGRLHPRLHHLSKIQIMETCTSGCIFIGES